jgi:hypothetical protein
MENIFTVAKPFLTFAKLLGVFPMSFEGSARRGLLKVHLTDLIYPVFAQILLFSNLFYSLFAKSFYHHSSDSKITTEGWNVIVKLGKVVVICQIIGQLWKRKNFVRFLNMIQNFDMQVTT